MARSIRPVRHPLALLLVLSLFLIAASCAKSTLGKAIQAADLQKQLVETSAVEIVKLHLRGDPRVTDEVYARSKALYQRYYISQSALSVALASWRTVSSASNEATLTTALTEVTKHINVYLSFAGQFVDLTSLRQKAGG